MVVMIASNPFGNAVDQDIIATERSLKVFDDMPFDEPVISHTAINYPVSVTLVEEETDFNKFKTRPPAPVPDTGSSIPETIHPLIANSTDEELKDIVMNALQHFSTSTRFEHRFVEHPSRISLISLVGAVFETNEAHESD